MKRPTLSSRFSACTLLLGVLNLLCVVPWRLAQPAAALAGEPSQTQPAAQPAQTPAEKKPQYTPEQQQQLDRANDLLTQVSKLKDQGKYAEAIALAAEALMLREAVLGPEHPDTAYALGRLATIQQYSGNLAEALPLYQRALKIFEKALGPDHLSVATACNNLAELYRNQGNYTEALPLFQRAIKIDEKALGPDHPLVATACNNLALLYDDQGNYAEALLLYQRALKIDEKALGLDHPGLASDLNNLAGLYRAQGNYAEALPLYQRALKIFEKALGPDHLSVATACNNLAGLYEAQGNYAETLPLFQRSLKIREKVLGPDNPAVAVACNNLAELYRNQGNYTEALPLFQRAIKIDEKALGPDHPLVATACNNLAGLYKVQKNYVEALLLYQRALKIDEKALGLDHPGLASDLNNLAGLYRAQGNYAEALPLYQRALKIFEKALGPDHLSVATACNNLAGLYKAQGNYVEALPLYQRAAKSISRHLELTAAVQSERQQLENIKTDRNYLDSYVSCALLAAEEEQANAVYTQMLTWKGAVTLRQRLERAARQSDNPVEQKLWNNLQMESTQLALASRATPKPEQHDAWLQKLTDLTQQKEQLEADLSQRSAEFRKLRWQTKLTPDALAQILPEETALVDLLQIHRRNDEKQPDGTIKICWEQRLVAFVVRPDQKVAMIDLGLVEPINTAVENWRETYGGNVRDLAPDEQPGMKLRRLVWEPLVQHLDGIKTVLVSPDGQLAKFPWGALTGSKPGSYLIEDGIAIALIPVPQMLPDLLNDKKSEPDQKTPTLLALGDVNYNAAPDDPPPVDSRPKPPKALLAVEEHRSAIRGERGMRFPALPGTAQEIKQIEQLYCDRFAGSQPLELIQSSATQQRLRAEASKYCYLHLATHGFFAPPEVKSARAENQQPAQAQQPGQEQQVVGFNPGLLSGIVLAGANRGNHPESSSDPTASPSDDGIMTALEVASLDLQNVDLVTLSACETGLGKETSGEGMLGLQRAFQVAGARTTISSLWSVDDAATQTMMSQFYSKLWDKDQPLGKLEALHQAQLEMLRHYDPQTQKLVDRGRGLELDTLPSDNGGRLSPKYWAAFQLSGDWR